MPDYTDNATGTTYPDQAFQDFYNSLYQSAVAKYVGQGKTFADEAALKKYISGEGKGLEEFFGGGATGSGDPVLRQLAQAGQFASGRGGGPAGDKYVAYKDPAFQKFYADWLRQHPEYTGGKSSGPTQSDQDAYDAWKKTALQRLDDVSKQMGKPLDQLLKEGDLGARSAYDSGANQAATAAYGRGLGGGGISNQNSERAALSAGLGYQMNRQALGLQATQGLMGGLQQEYMNAEDRYRYNQNMNLQMQNAQANAQAYDAQRKAQGMQMVGSVVGGVLGGVGSMYGGGSFGSGFQVGSQVGGGLGNTLGASSYQPYQYQYPSGQRPSGGGLGGGGTGNGGGGYHGYNPYQGSQ